MLHLTSVSLLEYTVPVSLVCTCRFPQLCTPPCWTPWWVGSGVGEHSPLNMTSQNQKPKTPKKRHIVDSDSELSLENEPLTTPIDDWPRFIILTSANSEKPIGKLSPFAIHKGILGIAGVVKDVKKLRSGDILVECAKKAHAENLLRATALAGVGMKASPHWSLNSSKGVIRTRDLGDMDEEEIASELRDQGVKRMVTSSTLIHTFSRSASHLHQRGCASDTCPYTWIFSSRIRCVALVVRNMVMAGILVRTCLPASSAANRVTTAQTARRQPNVQTVKVTMWLHRKTVLFGRKKSKSKR